ncbi:MAG TPA: 3,4-dehydroadipyl-CoA semialdehyde dehydrogenase [Hyphomicrobiales bacterium]|nr:3,4-dehydroadipyl-CoA semialdehyde dehydrogenase [Rhodobiaceae bacterium]HXK53614.1 3,4-dehydroadipyl-CoA semialdehyde dehydrogenase [Hyphomicrobiales bacterium]
MKLESYVEGRWHAGSGAGRPFADPVNGELLGHVDGTGIDGAAALAYARDVGGPALRALTFAERGALIRAIADTLGANRDAYMEIARRNSGNTAFDASVDIDGAIATLKVYARYGKELGDTHSIMEQGTVQLAKEDVFRAGHIWTTRPGAGLHINAFNFPAWGVWEKIAVSLLAGVPALSKPASATAWLSCQMVRDVVEAGVLPNGAISLVCGNGDGLLEGLTAFDGLAFTGSAATAHTLRRHPNILIAAPRFNVEADSVNGTILGPDARPGDAVFDLLVRELVSAFSVKAGQMCTNIRRIMVPAERLKDVREAVAAKLDNIVIGDPAVEGVRMGPLVSKSQQKSAFDGLERLKSDARVITGGGLPERIQGGDLDKGCFVAPTLLECGDPDGARAVHEIEVFGPVATLIPYRDQAHAIALANRGGGSLAISLFSNDADFAAQTAVGIAPSHGRLMVVDESVGKNHTGHQYALAHCVHGGPGRAGDGEELGGLRGLRFYMQRSAVQGSPALLERLAGNAAPACL